MFQFCSKLNHNSKCKGTCFVLFSFKNIIVCLLMTQFSLHFSLFKLPRTICPYSLS